MTVPVKPRILPLPFATRALAAALFLGLLPARATVVMGPLLEGATTTNVYVLAECTATTALTVRYGLTTNYGSSATTAFTKSTGNGTYVVHRIKLTGLQPNKVYHYQLSGQGTNTADFTFRTLVNAGTNFRFVWQADFRTGTAVHNTIAGRILNTDRPLFVLEGGDTCNTGDYAGWHNEFFQPNQRELQKWIPTYPTPGNHEGWGRLSQAFYQFPDSTGTNGYYSFDCGDLHVTMGNFQTSYASGSAQYNWIQRDVQASLKPWKIFGAHAPAYCSGGHGEDAGFKTITSRILEPNGVRVFLAGHSHFYQHNLVNGLHHLVVGGAGAPLYAPGTAGYTLMSAQDNCYLVADVSPTNLHMVVYNNRGTVLDTIRLVKLPPPTGLVASPGDGRVGLTWRSVARAANYTVHYGTTNGGPYAARVTTSTTNATLTNLINNTPYYFVVTAADTNGPSAVSVQISATAARPDSSPAIALTAPTNGARFPALATINLAASVTSNGAAIDRVQFYSHATNLLGQDAVPPYTFAWTTARAGNYSVTARAVFNGASTVDSPSVSLTVTNRPLVIAPIGRPSQGRLVLGGQVSPAQVCVLFSASSFTPPVVWTPIATNVATPAGVFTFSVPIPTNQVQRFYRIGTP